MITIWAKLVEYSTDANNVDGYYLDYFCYSGHEDGDDPGKLTFDVNADNYDDMFLVLLDDSDDQYGYVSTHEVTCDEIMERGAPIAVVGPGSQTVEMGLRDPTFIYVFLLQCMEDEMDFDVRLHMTNGNGGLFYREFSFDVQLANVAVVVFTPVAALMALVCAGIVCAIWWRAGVRPGVAGWLFVGGTATHAAGCAVLAIDVLAYGGTGENLLGAVSTAVVLLVGAQVVHVVGVVLRVVRRTQAIMALLVALVLFMLIAPIGLLTLGGIADLGPPEARYALESLPGIAVVLSQVLIGSGLLLHLSVTRREFAASAWAVAWLFLVPAVVVIGAFINGYYAAKVVYSILLFAEPLFFGIFALVLLSSVLPRLLRESKMRESNDGVPTASLPVAEDLVEKNRPENVEELYDEL